MAVVPEKDGAIGLHCCFLWDDLYTPNKWFYRRNILIVKYFMKRVYFCKSAGDRRTFRAEICKSEGITHPLWWVIHCMSYIAKSILQLGSPRPPDLVLFEQPAYLRRAQISARARQKSFVEVVQILRGWRAGGANTENQRLYVHFYPDSHQNVTFSSFPPANVFLWSRYLSDHQMTVEEKP